MLLPKDFGVMKSDVPMLWKFTAEICSRESIVCMYEYKITLQTLLHSMNIKKRANLGPQILIGTGNDFAIAKSARS